MIAKRPTLDSYFLSRESKIIFSLIYLDGETRAELLGITEEMYEIRKKADAWKRRIVAKIHPDKCDHPLAGEATAKALDMYKRMIRHAK